MPSRFKFRKSLPELPKGAERAIVEQFQAVEAAINEVQGPQQRHATAVLNVPQYAAHAGELVLLEGNANGTLVTIPAGSPQNVEQSIRIALVGGLLSPGVSIGIIGRKGTINGADTLTMTARGIVTLTSIGDRGWVSAASGGAGLTPLQVFEQIYPIGSIYISTNSTNPGTSLGFGTWTAFGAGRVPVGFAAGDPDFGVDEGTGGAKTVAAAGANTAVSAGTPAGTNSAPTFTGAAMANHNHTFTGSALANHAHELPISKVAGGTGATRFLAPTVFGTGTSRTSETSFTEAADATAAAVMLSQSVSAGTPAGTNTAGSAGTPSGTVSAPTFTGAALATHNHTFTGTPTSVLPPYIVVRMWKRTA